MSSALKAVQPNVLYAGPQELPVNWAPLQPPTQSRLQRHGFGPELMVGKTISDACGGQRVAEIKFAVNGPNHYLGPGNPGPSTPKWSPG